MYPKYLAKPLHEKRALLKILLSNCALDTVNLVPTYRSPFDLIAKAVRDKDWGPCHVADEGTSPLRTLTMRVSPMAIYLTREKIGDREYDVENEA